MVECISLFIKNDGVFTFKHYECGLYMNVYMISTFF